ncbi:MAG: squalene synthase HpnC [Chloracidobacterium sp. CP2_5A]|nr:MAG: squalene synthase HpnC [Chloracidobacterium sp. CP2_5A]
MSLEEAYAYCRRVALGHYENFPVGSLVLPKAIRPRVYAVYAFARAADDFADEGALPAEERLARLADWRRQLAGCADGEAAHPVFVALGDTIRRHRLPMQLFHDLLDAFELDARRSRHATFEDLLDYSRRSANPVGRLILLLFGYRDPAWHQMSDAICTALQLTNFWQDVAVDAQKNRIYIPLSEMAAQGYAEQDLLARRYAPGYERLMEGLANRTEALFERGRPLCALAPGRLGFELRLIWLGGMTILTALRRIRFNVFDQRPTLGARDKARLALSALRRSRFLPSSNASILQTPA